MFLETVLAALVTATDLAAVAVAVAVLDQGPEVSAPTPFERLLLSRQAAVRTASQASKLNSVLLQVRARSWPGQALR